MFQCDRFKRCYRLTSLVEAGCRQGLLIFLGVSSELRIVLQFSDFNFLYSGKGRSGRIRGSLCGNIEPKIG